jgi:uncharacterized MAPEG superfamily protein
MFYMHLQLLFLAMAALFLSIAWIPSAILRIQHFGLRWPFIQLDDAAGQPLTGAGRRLELAYRHLLVNFAPYPATVMILAKMEIADVYTASASATFMLCRIAHFVLYGLDHPALRVESYILSLAALFYLSWRAIGVLIIGLM